MICACGHTFKTRSTHKGDIRVEICSNCHPFFTGKQKLIDTAGRVEKFEKKYVKSRAAKKEAAGSIVAGPGDSVAIAATGAVVSDRRNTC